MMTTMMMMMMMMMHACVEKDRVRVVRKTAFGNLSHEN